VRREEADRFGTAHFQVVRSDHTRRFDGDVGRGPHAKPMLVGQEPGIIDAIAGMRESVNGLQIGHALSCPAGSRCAFHLLDAGHGALSRRGGPVAALCPVSDHRVTPRLRQGFIGNC